MKLAGHVEDRLQERSNLDPSVLAEARGKLSLLPKDGASTYHWTLRDGDKVHGHLAVRRVGKKQTPVLTTFLGPNMTPSGTELSLHTGPLSAATRPMEKAATAFLTTYAGLRVHVDRPKGFVQKGKDEQGNPWTRTYKVDYGSLPKTEGGDGEDLDVFLGPKETASTAQLIYQKKADGSFDEFKLMLGFESPEKAKECYLDHVPARFFDKMEPVSLHLVKALLGYPMDGVKVAAEAMLREVFSEKRATSEQGEEGSVAHAYRQWLRAHADRPHQVKYEGLRFPSQRVSPGDRPHDLRPDQVEAINSEEAARLMEQFRARMREHGVEPLHPSKWTDLDQKDYLGGQSMQRNRAESPAQVIKELGKVPDLITPGTMEKLYGKAEEASGNRDRELYHGTKLREMVENLNRLDPADREGRTKALQDIMREDADVFSARMKGLGKGFAHASIPWMKANPGKVGLGAVGVGAMGALQFGALGKAHRAYYANKLLTPEERLLPDAEQGKLMAERSPMFKRLGAKGDDTSDITFQDVAAPLINVPAMDVDKKMFKAIDAHAGGHLASFLDPHEAMSRLVGAQQFWHGTTPDAGEKILGTKDAPGTGIDPGHGGRKGGFTWRATHQDDLARTARRLEEIEAPARRRGRTPHGAELDRYAASLGADVGGASAYQPKQFLPGMASLGEGGHLDLDTSHFLDNAKGNYFVATDRGAAEAYARSLSPDVYTKPFADLRAAGERIQERMNNKSMGLNRGTYEDLASGYDALTRATGVKDPAPDKKYLIGGVMPVEKFKRLHEVDSDDVKQRGYAYRLKPENRVTPYAPGEMTDPSSHGKAIGIEHLNHNQATIGQILANKAENWTDYVRGVDLPQDERMLGLNKRFLSGVGRAGATAGAYGLMYAGSGLHPLVKKLYNKAKGRLTESPSATTPPESPAEDPEPKTAAPRWLKVLREGGEGANEVRKAMKVYRDEDLDVLARAKDGIFDQHGLVRPGLGIKPEGRPNPIFEDPTLSFDTALVRNSKGGWAKGDGLPLGFHIYTGFPHFSDADRRAIYTNPNLAVSGKEHLPPTQAAKSKYEGWEHHRLEDLLHLGDNPGLGLTAMADPKQMEGLRGAMTLPIRVSRQAARDREDPPTLYRKAFDVKKEDMEEGRKPWRAKDVFGPARLGTAFRGLSTETPESIKEKTLGGLLPWYRGDDKQLGFGVVPPVPPPRQRASPPVSLAEKRKRMAELVGEAETSGKKDYGMDQMDLDFEGKSTAKSPPPAPPQKTAPPRSMTAPALAAAGVGAAGLGLAAHKLRKRQAAQEQPQEVVKTATIEKEALPRWIKQMKKDPELSGEIARRMRLSESLQDAIAASPRGGLLTPTGLPRPGLAQEGLDVSKAQQQFKDPMLNLESVVGMRTREPQGRARDVGPMKKHLLWDRLEHHEAVGDISPEDRLAINTHPNLLSRERWQRDAFGKHTTPIRDALQTGSNPALDLQALMDPEFGQALQDRVRSPYKLRAGHAFDDRTEARRLFDTKKELMNLGVKHVPSVQELSGGPQPLHGSFGYWPPDLARYARQMEENSVGGLRGWYDPHGENPDQLGFGITLPKPGDVGEPAKHTRRMAAIDARFDADRAQRAEDHAKRMASLRQLDLFHEVNGNFHYNDYDRNPKPAPPPRTAASTPGAEELRSAYTPAPVPAPVPAPAPDPVTTIAPEQRSLVVPGLLGASGALALGALGRRAYLKHKEREQQERELPSQPPV